MRKLIILGSFIFMLCFLFGCSSQNKSVPAPLPEIKIAVAWFNQPRSMDELLAGVMASEQDFVGDKILFSLDKSFNKVLKETTQRKFIDAAGTYTHQVKASRVPKKGTALEYWGNVGAALGADMILVPQLTEWSERNGGDYGAEQAAGVTMDFYLIDVKEPRLINRYHFEETQETLTANLLALGKFVNRKGRWLTANDLAEEGMRSAVKELGL